MSRSPSVALAGHTDEGERFDDFAIRQEWWTGDVLPDAKVVRRELAGEPKIEVVGRSKEKVKRLFWDAVTQARAELAGDSKDKIHSSMRQKERNGHGGSTFPPSCAMMPAWIHAPWNGSATTS